MTREVSTIRAGTAPTGGGFLRLPLADVRETALGRHADHDLIESVRMVGVLEPILVARSGDTYELLAGARRLHAAREAGLADIPALIIPPDRAGPLEVYVAENLRREPLAESDRQRLRDQWMRETGRDEGQALGHIPEPSVIIEEPECPPAGWKYAALTLGAICLVLVGLLAARTTAPTAPRGDYGQSPVAAVTVPPAVAKESAWMAAFAFPGEPRSVRNNRLTLTFRASVHDGAAFSREGRRALYQLAAVLNAAEPPLAARLLFASGTPGYAEAAALDAATLMQQEGVERSKAIPLAAKPMLGDTIHLVVEIYPAP
jgi:hypothetical protein